MTDRTGGRSRRPVRRAATARMLVEVVADGATGSPRLASWLRTIAPARVRGTVTVAIISDARVRRLNRVYRKQDQPTDVLSFPSEDDGCLGDIAIAAGVARRQAMTAGHTLQTELRVLALHGLLHLLGYDHDHDDGLMARVETRLRRRGGLREGLIERRS